jgi:hypothetical protein
MSVKLSCSATTCVHNMSALCSANYIEVTGNNAHSSAATECNTFAERGLKNAVTNMVNMNVVGEIKQIFTNSSVEMSPKIKCEAVTCNYNENRVCAASNVQIHGPSASTSEGTQCETFVE